MMKTRLSLSMLVALAPVSLHAQSSAETAIGGGMGILAGLLIVIITGAIVGWLASLLVSGSGSGFWMDVLIGIGGSVLAGFLFPALGIGFGGGIVGAFLPAIIGAVILLLIIRLIRRGA